MNAESLLKAFKDLFPWFKVWSYKRMDPHSIEVTCPDFPAKYYIFTYYGERNWKLETGNLKLSKGG